MERGRKADDLRRVERIQPGDAAFPNEVVVHGHKNKIGMRLANPFEGVPHLPDDDAIEEGRIEILARSLTETRIAAPGLVVKDLDGGQFSQQLNEECVGTCVAVIGVTDEGDLHESVCPL